MFYFFCRFDGGSNIVGFHDCLPNNDRCSLSYRLNNDVSEGGVVNIDSLSRTSGRYYTVNYSTSESMSVFFSFYDKLIFEPKLFNHMHLYFNIIYYTLYCMLNPSFSITSMSAGYLLFETYLAEPHEMAARLHLLSLTPLETSI